MKKKVVIIAPFWKDPEHVGMYRTQRFFNWMKSEKYEIIVLSVGERNIETDYEWGKEIRITDPLKIYRTKISAEGITLPVRKENNYRRFIAYLFLIPDPLIFWVLKAARNNAVAKAVKDAQFVISSSPPEASHILAYKISKMTKSKLVIDLRDGWIDEPLKDVLKLPVRKSLEKYIEKKILSKSDRIFVTSEKWKKLLINRIAGLEQKVTVLTNGYPPKFSMDTLNIPKADNSILLIHAGRFKAGRRTHDINLLLKPLFSHIRSGSIIGKILLLGDLIPEEISEIELWKKKFDQFNWKLSSQKSVTRSEMLKLLQKADGLLLLSASEAPIPSKVFEYISTRKPILALTTHNSAVWELAKQISQMSVIDIHNFEGDEGRKVWSDYLQRVKSGDYTSVIPEEYSESALKDKFINNIILIS